MTIGQASDAAGHAQQEIVNAALSDLKKMTLTVIDGDFLREVVGAQNLIFGDYRMLARRNSSEFYDAKEKKPAGSIRQSLLTKWDSQFSRPPGTLQE